MNDILAKIPPQRSRPSATDDTTMPGLNLLNSQDVIDRANASGRLHWTTGHVTHKFLHELKISTFIKEQKGLWKRFLAFVFNTPPVVETGYNNFFKIRSEYIWLYDDGGFARECTIPYQIDDEGDKKYHYPPNLYPACPLCFKYHPESATNPNACKKRPQVKFTECLVCKNYYSKSKIKSEQKLRRFFYDLRDPEVSEQLDDTRTSTEYLTDTLKMHIKAWHPNTAAEMGL